MFSVRIARQNLPGNSTFASSYRIKETAMFSRFSIKSLLCISAIVLSIILSSCVASAIPPSSSITATATATIQPTDTQAPAPTEDLATQRQKIWDEVVREVTEFNQLVEQEKLLGNVETSHNNETGQDFFTFTGESDKKIRAAHDHLINQINNLHDRYLALYKQDYDPTPFPTFSTKEEALNFYYQTMQEDQDWLETQGKAESVLKIYDPDRGSYMSLLSFEQSDWLALRNEALNQLRMEAELSPELLAKHKAIVEKLDGGTVVSSEIDSRPYYRNDVTLFQYQTQKNYYLLDADGAIIEITPVNQDISTQLVLVPGSAAGELTPNAPLNTNQLEHQARAFINLIAPGTNVDVLTPSIGSKVSDFFFKWEDQTKPLLDGGGFPFIQVAINSDGELLNYVNTLPLSR